MSIIKKLINIQSELNAPKGQRNNFGKYNYRSCEDILEAVKPLLKQEGLFLFINDEIELVGDRYYVKATATLTDGENSQSSSAYARESAVKKGMDDSQITGATSSYARKYALNGLLCIDDNKDADTDAHQHIQQSAPKPKPKMSNHDQILEIFTKLASSANAETLKAEFSKVWGALKGHQNQAKAKEVYDIRKSELEIGDL